jgi:hypothetical protein
MIGNFYKNTHNNPNVPKDVACFSNDSSLSKQCEVIFTTFALNSISK